MTAFDTRDLRNAFGTFMTGVTVVTSHTAQGEPIGFTANSFTSVSLDPPMILVCLAKTSQNYDTLVNGEGFAVNILSEHQTEISNTFARPVEDRYAGIAWHKGPAGSPIIGDVSAWFDCKMHKAVDAGDHVILIGLVEAFDSTTTPGLGYARGAYVTPSATTDTLVQNTTLVVSALIERNGEVLLVDDGVGGAMLPEAIVSKEGTSTAVKRLITETGLVAQPGFVYSVFEDPKRKRQHISFLCQAAEGDPKTGTFVPLNHANLTDVTDPAIKTMLERFAAESVLGNYGIYCGNQDSGEVRSIA